MMSRMRRQEGFTLIEIAIAIVVIGLIAGGIMYGRSLLRSAKVNKTISEVATYKQAITQFRHKYNALPGDFPDAESFWGADSSCPNTTANIVNKKATCDGNGDGRIAVYDYAAATTTAAYEANRSWQHMANAGFIPGSFSGTLNTGNTYVADKTNPAAAVDGGVYGLWYINNHDGTNANEYPIRYSHVIALFTVSSFGGETKGPALTAQEALMLDLKIDDGRPGIGEVQSRPPAFTPDCTDSATASAANYIGTDNSDEPACYLYFLLDKQ